MQIEQYLRDIDPAEVGRLLKEYVAESVHNNWDGFTRADLTGIRRFLLDLELYHKSVVSSNPEHFKQTSSVNPS